MSKRAHKKVQVYNGDGKVPRTKDRLAAEINAALKADAQDAMSQLEADWGETNGDPWFSDDDLPDNRNIPEQDITVVAKENPFPLAPPDVAVPAEIEDKRIQEAVLRKINRQGIEPDEKEKARRDEAKRAIAIVKSPTLRYFEENLDKRDRSGS